MATFWHVARQHVARWWTLLLSNHCRTTDAFHSNGFLVACSNTSLLTFILFFYEVLLNMKTFILTPHTGLLTLTFIFKSGKGCLVFKYWVLSRRAVKCAGVAFFLTLKLEYVMYACIFVVIFCQTFQALQTQPITYSFFYFVCSSSFPPSIILNISKGTKISAVNTLLAKCLLTFLYLKFRKVYVP